MAAAMMASSSSPAPLDGIIVPGGGLSEGGNPHPFVMKRLEEAAKIYTSQGEERRPKIICLSCGTTHKPPPLDMGFPITEASAGARFLIQQYGVRVEDVLEEGLSLDTIGNAYFLRTTHTDVAGLYRLAVVTNKFHMPRTEAIFRLVFGLADQRGQVPPYQLTFLAVPDVGMDDDAADARRAKEAKAIESFQATIQAARIYTLADMHAFLYRDHLAYASKRLLTVSQVKEQT